MRSSVTERSLRRPAGALLALLGWALVAPSVARAGCSHYVTYQAERDALAVLFAPSVVGVAEDQPAGRWTPPPPQRPRPCSGPSCSKPPAAPAVPSVAVTRHVEAWAFLGDPLAPPGLTSTRLDAPASRPCPVRTAGTVFHPPRPSDAT